MPAAVLMAAEWASTGELRLFGSGEAEGRKGPELWERGAVPPESPLGDVGAGDGSVHLYEHCIRTSHEASEATTSFTN